MINLTYESLQVTIRIAFEKWKACSDELEKATLYEVLKRLLEARRLVKTLD